VFRPFNRGELSTSVFDVLAGVRVLSEVEAS
jgi:hypothetical protein